MQEKRSPRQPEEEVEDNEMAELPPRKRYFSQTCERGSAVKNVTRDRSDLKEVVQKTLHYLDAGNSSAPVLEMEEKSIMRVEEQGGETEVTVNGSPAIYIPLSAVGESSEPKVAAALDVASSSSGAEINCLDAEKCSSPVLETAKTNICVEERDGETEDTLNAITAMVVPPLAVEQSSEQKVAAKLELASSTSGEANICLQNSTEQSPETETVSDIVKVGDESGAADNSMGLVVVPECDISADEWRAISNIKDITVGEENIEIPWVNEINDEVPSRFRYIPQSLVFQDAAVKFSVSSFSDEQGCFSCIGDCCLDSSSMPCKCTVAYTADGVLKEDFLEDRISEARDQRKQVLQFCQECPLEKAKKEETLEPCQGHIKRKAIKECWIKCGCAKRCGNRVVQRGIHNKLEVFFTPNGKGWGLRTLEKLPKGAFVSEYVGEVLTISELYQHSFEDKLTSPVILDGTRYGNISRFLNHRCLDANLIEIPLAFFTTRDIEAMEELTWDYGIDFYDDDSPMKPFDCLCGSRFCRNMKRSKRAKKLMNRA